MYVDLFVVGVLAAAGQTSTAPSVPLPSPCAQAIQWAADPAVAAICAGEDADKLASAAASNSTEHTRQLEAASAHYRRAVSLARSDDARLLALQLLARSFDGLHLNDHERRAAALADLIRIRPNDLGPVSQLAALQEEQGLLEVAESTLLDARRQHPEVVEPYRLLAQFYARRAMALHREGEKRVSAAPSSGAGEPDDQGIYRVGGPVPPPKRLDVAQYPPEAQAAGVKGAVVAELVIDATGQVTQARVVESIPMLDEPALAAVRNWRFAPAIVNGAPVPVRMNVTVNFSLR